MIFKAGFDSEEANTNGVVVAQRPAGTSIPDFNKNIVRVTRFLHPR